MTDRALASTQPRAYGGGRGGLSYEQFTMQAVISPAGGDAGSPAASHPADPSQDFVTTGRWTLDKAQFQEAVDGAQKADDRIVLFVHGYNTSYQEAVFRLAQLSAEADAFAVPILFSWPSQADFRGYLADRDSAIYARDDLVQLLTTLSRTRSKERIAVIGHSMGGLLVMEALRQLRLEGKHDVIDRLQVGLASPDIDIDVFRKQMAVIGPMSPPLVALVSSDDRALGLSSRLTGGKRRLGMTSADDPQLRDIALQDGVQIIDITSLPATDGMKHDRFIVFAARYSTALRKSESHGGVQRAGVYLFDAAGRILSAPFEQTAEILAGSPRMMLAATP